ncbi:MAG: hypothetical protein JW818_20055 [Pirellulales bacterium]|nr:hypothetical protein [Pirellulales bacterium]
MPETVSMNSASEECPTAMSDDSPGKPLSCRILRVGAKYTILPLLLFFLGRHVCGQWEAVEGVSTPQFEWLAYGTIVAIAALFTSVWGYRFLIRSHGFDVGFSETVGLCFVPMLGKYIPGKVWAILAAVHFYGTLGIPKRVAAACVALFMTLGLASSGLVALVLGLPVGAAEGLVWPVVAVMIVGLYPPVFYRVTNLALQMCGRNKIEANVSLVGILRVFTILVVVAILYGTGFFLILQGFRSTPWQELPAVIALFTFAQVAGFLALFAPAGIGVREGVLLLGLQPIVGPGPAIVITGVCRLWQTAIELIMAAFGWFALRRRKAFVSEGSVVSAATGQTVSREPCQQEGS